MDTDKVQQPEARTKLNTQATTREDDPDVELIWKRRRLRPVYSVLDYLTALRLLCCTYARVGSWQVDKLDKEGNPVKDKNGDIVKMAFFPWEVALRYVD